MTALLREAPSAERIAAYQARAFDLLAAGDALSDQQVRLIFDHLSSSRRRVSAELLAIPPEDGKAFRASQLRRLQTAIDRAAADLLARTRPAMGAALDQAWDVGAARAPSLLQSAGVDLVFSREISRLQLAVAQEIAADLVVQVSADFRQQARALVARGLLGEQSPYALAQSVAALLKTEPGRKDPRLGPIASQAERIVRTETMGAAALADAIRTREISAAVPGLKKYWLATPGWRTRPAHAAASQRYQPGGSEGPIPVDKDFSVGGEHASFPHDPRLSAKNRVSCRCIQVLYSPDWF